MISIIKKKILHTPPRFEGGLILNLLGIHFLRIAFFYFIHLVRKTKFENRQTDPKLLNQLNTDGFVIIENFLPSEQFLKLKNSLEESEVILPITNQSQPLLKRATLTSENFYFKDKDIIQKNFVSNEFLNNLVGAHLYQKVNLKPSVKYEISKYENLNFIGSKMTDYIDNLHFDVSFPTVKCFLYLNDVNLSNAPFTFVPGSHKFSITRSFMEYKLCIKSYLNGYLKDKITPPVDKSYLNKMIFKEKAITGKANTLIVANTMGLHRRGDYMSTDPRKMLIIDYRQLGSPIYMFRNF